MYLQLYFPRSFFSWYYRPNYKLQTLPGRTIFYSGKSLYGRPDRPIFSQSRNNNIQRRKYDKKCIENRNITGNVDGPRVRTARSASGVICARTPGIRIPRSASERKLRPVAAVWVRWYIDRLVRVARSASQDDAHPALACSALTHTEHNVFPPPTRGYVARYPCTHAPDEAVCART